MGNLVATLHRWARPSHPSFLQHSLSGICHASLSARRRGSKEQDWSPYLYVPACTRIASLLSQVLITEAVLHWLASRFLPPKAGLSGTRADPEPCGWRGASRSRAGWVAMPRAQQKQSGAAGRSQPSCPSRAPERRQVGGEGQRSPLGPKQNGNGSLWPHCCWPGSAPPIPSARLVVHTQHRNWVASLCHPLLHSWLGDTKQTQPGCSGVPMRSTGNVILAINVSWDVQPAVCDNAW